MARMGEVMSVDGRSTGARAPPKWLSWRFQHEESLSGRHARERNAGFLEEETVILAPNLCTVHSTINIKESRKNGNVQSRKVWKSYKKM